MDTYLNHLKFKPFLKKAFSSKPWYIIFYVTSHCNQRCHMCFQHEMLNTLKRSEEWQIDEIEKLSKNLPNLYQLTLTGGEPTLRKDLGEIVKVFHKNSDVDRVTITTNGYYPQRVIDVIEYIFNNCPEINLSINMSIDGIGEDHDKIRGLKKSFDNLFETYKEVQKLKKTYKKLNSQTASVLMLSNKDKMKDLLDWIDNNMNISEHGLMLARGDIPSEEGKATENSYFDEMLDYHRALSKKNEKRISKAIGDSLKEERINSLYKEKMVSPCLAGRKLLIIDERANLLPCEILKVLHKEGKTDEPSLGDFSFGNLRDFNYDPNYLINTEKGKKINKYIKDERCWCSFECAQIQNFVLNPTNYFKIIKNYTKNLF